jgi:hypothetical protein
VSRTPAPKLSPAAADSIFRIEKAYTDSAVSTNERKEKLAYKVALTDFTTSEAKSTVAGSVTNQGTAQRAITLRFEFLDKGGNVVATKEAAVGEVAAGGTSRFTVTATPGTSIVAFRYARIE